VYHTTSHNYDYDYIIIIIKKQGCFHPSKITKQLPIVELLEFDFKVVNYAIQQFEENVLLLHITLMLSLYERFSCQFSEIKK